jgi:hypothetical protein
MREIEALLRYQKFFREFSSSLNESRPGLSYFSLSASLVIA